MSNVVSFTGGKHCADCDEQISPKRLQANPEAQLCIDCQKDRDRTLSRAADALNSCGRGRPSVQERGSVTIKW